VRFISNYSTGKMGFALAKNAVARGAKVILISGPNQLPPIEVDEVITVETAEEMKVEVFKHFAKAKIIISAAAVADFRPRKTISGKIKKTNSQNICLDLEKTSDILAELGKKKEDKILVGFAAEAENLVENALKKLKEKHLDLIIANNISVKDIGFASDKNSAKIISKEGTMQELPIMQKSDMAVKILDKILKIEQKKN